MTTIIIIIISIIFSAIFSGMEIAFVSSNKLRIEMIVNNKTSKNNIFSKITKNPSLFISTMLVGNNFMLVLYGIYMQNLLTPVLKTFIVEDFWLLLIQTIISSLIILFLGEFLPKILFRINSYGILNRLSFLAVFFYIIFYPIITISMLLSELFLKLFIRNSNINKDISYTKFDVEEIIDRAADNAEKQVAETEFNNLKIIQNIMDFPAIIVRECMIPRNRINAINIDAGMQKVLQKFTESGNSNLIVYEDVIDNVIGYINVKDIFKNQFQIQDILRTIIIVPETMYVKDLLKNLIKENKSIAVVVDEFGSINGLISSEDILEEIFGEFEDEHDVSAKKVIVNKEGNLIISGLQEVDIFNKLYGYSLSKSDDYETIAGYILFHTDNFPEKGDIIIINDNGKKYKFKILMVSDTKIEKVLMYENR
ncbi:MAG: hemolysin family protein [Bacteroidales bacterium]|jgi:CBS domain containing-hemolysin-like protein|nr:hemolysin family protein [Bacteroidales bacterium]